MESLPLWLLIPGLAATSYFPRGSFLLFFARHPLPQRLHAALRFVPPAVFTALVLPELVYVGDHAALGAGNPRLLAGLAAAIVAWRSGNTLLTLLAGMLALHGLRALGLG